MDNYYPPEGFTKDESTGLYYQTMLQNKEDGTQVQIVTWFNSETGEYQQQEYPQQESQQQVSQQQEFQREEGMQSEKKKKKGLFVVVVIGVLVGGGYLFANKTLIKEASLEVFMEEGIKTENDVTKIRENTTKEIEGVETTEEFVEESSVMEKVTEEITEEITEEVTVQELETEVIAAEATEEYVLTEENIEFQKHLLGAVWATLNYGSGSFSFTEENAEELDLGDDEDDDTVCFFTRSEYDEKGWRTEGFILECIGEGYLYGKKPYYFEFTINSDSSFYVTYSPMENHVVSVSASSELTDKYGTYKAKNVLDQDPTTAWTVGEGNPIGESITFTFDKEREVYAVMLLNGYWKSDATHKNNGHVTKFDVYSGKTWETTIDCYGEVYNQQAASQKPYDVLGLVEGGIVTDSLKLMIADTQTGAKYNDICVSEILLLTK